MQKIFISPARYVQGKDELANIGSHMKMFGTRAALVASQEDYDRVKAQIEASAEKEGVQITHFSFGGECTLAELDRIKGLIDADQTDVVIALGGGKALDTGKAVAYDLSKPVMVVPTIAATDAPTSKTTVVYTAAGEFDQYMYQEKNPDFVLVDTAVIAKAPKRFLVSGMGDALATVFEARACKQGFAPNVPGGHSTKTAIAIAELCYETLLEDGLKAMAACEQGVVTQALENIVEANILMSGLGFESSGLAGAHAVADGLTMLEEAHGYYHGEKVAFGTIVQLVLENAEYDLICEVIDFCRSVGLPTRLADLNITNVTAEKLIPVAELACSDRDTMGNMPFKVTEEDVIAAILATDRLGEYV